LLEIDMRLAPYQNNERGGKSRMELVRHAVAPS